ncbi:hypothetical protein, partial [Eudoraea sp.]
MTISSSIKIILKRLLLGMGLLVALLGIISVIFYQDGKEWILDEIQLYVSEIQTGDLEIEEIELALFRHLPNFSVSLKNINYYEKKKSLRAEGDMPILSAENLNLAFEPWQLIRHRHLKVNSVSIEKGSFNIIEYSDNKINLENALASPGSIQVPKTSKDTLDSDKPKKPVLNTTKSPKISKSEVVEKDFEIDLKSIELKEVMLMYHSMVEGRSSQLDLA